MSKRFNIAVRFVQKKHAGQFRAGGVPAWHHLARVSQTLATLLQRTKEGTRSEREHIIVAALGHDVLEDTAATERDVVAVFGDRSTELVRGMTNTWGDDHTKPYERQIVQSEEAVRLIKLADLYDNYTSVTHHVRELGTTWTKTWFLPIVAPMYRAVSKTKFVVYPNTAGMLIAMVSVASELLQGELRRTKTSRTKSQKK